MMEADIPEELTAQVALALIHKIAAVSSNIVLVSHALKRGHQRRINRIMVERCLMRGAITEGPYVAAASGNWRMNVSRYAAGEEMTCVVEIDWPNKLLVVTVF